MGLERGYLAFFSSLALGAFHSLRLPQLGKAVKAIARAAVGLLFRVEVARCGETTRGITIISSEDFNYGDDSVLHPV